MVLAPEHSLVDSIVTEEQWPAVGEYRERTARKSDLERTDLAKEKTGVFTGAYAINPANDEKIPIWIADYVLLGYGTGAIMAVPAHDERDLEFARKFDLPIRQVVQPSGGEEAVGFVGDGIAINSPVIDGLTSREAIRKITAWLEQRGLGKGTINYKLRDWLFSRQRYWGEPFPIVWEDGNHRSLGEIELPVVPPPLEDYQAHRDRRATAVQGEGLDSLFRQSDSRNERRCRNGPARVGIICDSAIRTTIGVSLAKRPNVTGWAAEKPGGVDLYVGGTEHAVLHLLYARFWQKVLFDLGYVSKPEPFQRLVNQGIILGEDNQKMSKSRGNIVNPDDVIDRVRRRRFSVLRDVYGTPGANETVEHARRGGRIAFSCPRLAFVHEGEPERRLGIIAGKSRRSTADKAQQKMTHATIRKVTEDIESFSFNTAISQMMIFVNAFTGAETIPLSIDAQLFGFAQSIRAASLPPSYGKD